jgi:hypothetical protein
LPLHVDARSTRRQEDVMSIRSVFTRTRLAGPHALPSLSKGLLLAAVLPLSLGCERSADSERRDADEARGELQRVEAKAAEDRSTADRDAVDERTKADREVAAARARLAEEEREAARADDGSPVGLDDELTRRLADLDARIRALRTTTDKVDGAPREKADAALAKIEKRRARMQRRIEDLEDMTSAELDQAKIDLARGMRELGAEVDGALGKARGAVHAM